MCTTGITSASSASTKLKGIRSIQISTVINGNSPVEILSGSDSDEAVAVSEVAEDANVVASLVVNTKSHCELMLNNILIDRKKWREDQVKR